MRRLTIELSDEQLFAIEDRAAAAGVTVDQLVQHWVDRELDLGGSGLGGLGELGELDLTDPLAGIATTIPDGARTLLSRR